MRNLVGVVIVSTALVGATSNAFAADLPVKAPPIVAAPFSWSGCYIGANAGWIGGRTTFNTSPGGTYLQPAGALAPPNAAGTGLLAGDLFSAQHVYDPRQSGAEVGGQIGCNRQWNSLVLGVEADSNWTSLRTSTSAFYPAFPSVSTGGFTVSRANEALASRLNWLSTVRARGGIAFDHWLLFATGGAAIGHFHSDTSVLYGSDGTSPVFMNAAHIGSDDRTRLGYAVGAGVEYALNNTWSFKAEYLFVQFQNWTYSVPLLSPAGNAGGYTWVVSENPREHIVRVGINYHFGWDPLVVARY